MRLVFERPLARYVCCSSFVASDTSVDCGHRCTDLRSIAGNQRTDYSSSESIRGYTCLVYLPMVGMCVHKYTAPNIARHTGVSRSYAEFWFLVARASKRLVTHRWKSCYPNTNAVNHYPRVYVLRRKAFSNICNGTQGMLSLFQSLNSIDQVQYSICPVSENPSVIASLRYQCWYANLPNFHSVVSIDENWFTPSF